MNDHNLITEETGIKYYSTIPHIIDDMGLPPAAIRLYLRLKRRVVQKTDGNTTGASWERTTNLAKACCISTGQVSKAKKILVEAGLIRIEKVPRGHGEFAYDRITIVNIWEANTRFYSDESPEEFYIFDEQTGKMLTGKEARQYLKIKQEQDPEGARVDFREFISHYSMRRKSW